MAAGITDPVWSFRESFTVKFEPIQKSKYSRMSTPVNLSDSNFLVDPCGGFRHGSGIGAFLRSRKKKDLPLTQVKATRPIHDYVMCNTTEEGPEPTAWNPYRVFAEEIPQRSTQKQHRRPGWGLLRE